MSRALLLGVLVSVALATVAPAASGEQLAFDHASIMARVERLIVLLTGKLSACEYVWRHVVVAKSLGITDLEIAELQKCNLAALCFNAEKRSTLSLRQGGAGDIQVTDATYV